MVRHITLSDLSPQKGVLLHTVARKISSNKFTTLNQDFDSNLKIELPVITSLIETIEARIRKAEIIYHSYLELVDHPTLCGLSSSLPLRIEMIFSHGTGTLTYSIEIDDRALYKEAIDLNFQHFILLMASLYENIVRLIEMLVKKVIVHQPGNIPLSTPLHQYIVYFQSLIKLGYRKHDYLYACLNTHNAFLAKILPPINSLRNRYIHGFQNHLLSDGYNYRINSNLAPTFSSGSPDLNIDEFSKLTITNTKMFFYDLFNALIQHIKHYSKFIPA